MLSKEEELRLASCIDVLKYAEHYDVDEYGSQGLDLKAQLWLAEKLKETNDELKRIKLYSTRNQISDRFYPREGGDTW